MASVVPYRGGWRVYLYANGKRRSKTFRTRSQALAWAAQQDVAHGRITFAAALERFLRWKLPQLDPNNQGHYEASLRQHALPVLGSRYVQASQPSCI